MSELPPTAGMLMDRLVTELEERGLKVVADVPTLTVKDPAVSGQDPHGQQVLLRNDGAVGLVWCWVWPGMRPAVREAPAPPAEVEPMCPADDVVRAADLITKVVRLRDPELAAAPVDV